MYSRGRGLGGSTLMNAMLYSRGFQEDWDKMPEGWRSADVAPHFSVVEQMLALREVRAGTFGQAVSDAAESIGVQRSSNSLWESDGVSTRYRSTIAADTGSRIDIYKEFGADRANIELIHGAAAQLLFNDCKAVVGLQLLNSKALQLAADGEVLLAAGAIDSAKLLQLSGIGPLELLNQLNIPVVQALPIGEGLRDHPLLPCIFLQKSWPPALSTLAPNSVQGWVHCTERGVKIDIIDGQSAAHIAAWGLMNPLRRPGFAWSVLRAIIWLIATLVAWLLWLCPKLTWLAGTVVGLNVSLLQPTSLGRVQIVSTNPLEAAAIDPNFLHTEEDKAAIHDGLMLVQRLVAAPPLAGTLIGVMPGLVPLSETAHIQSNTTTYYHPTGTCSIGPCVDTALRVRGVARLRVCDGSVLPVHPRAPTAASCMMIGARAAELILCERNVQVQSSRWRTI